MKPIQYFFLSLVLMTPGFLFSQPSPLRFEKSVQKFDKVDEGQAVVLKYVFINSNHEPVLIQEAKVNCNCTKVVFPKSPVNPATKDSLMVYFDTKGKIGYQERNIDVVTNAGTSQITFKGVVKASKQTKAAYKKK